MMPILMLGSNAPVAAQQQAPTDHVTASLNCGSHSANPKELKSFQVDLQFDVYGSLWMVDRKTSPQAGEEKFRGILSPTGMMLIAGQGKNPKGITILRGSLQSEQPKGMRTCSLTFESTP
jgi:hypothetical protein